MHISPDSIDHYDVVLLGGGLAGLTLARHLLLETDKTVLLLERRSTLPPERQKVGESSVQIGGYYYSRVLDLEEYLWRHHYMKYNLRFYWRSGGRDNSRFEDYSQGYIRKFSNIPSYQLDRNTFEAELLRRNGDDPRCDILLGVSELDVELAEAGPAAGRVAAGPHRIAFTHNGEAREVEADWVVDTTGRNKVLARRLGLRKSNPIRHASFFWWVDGLVDVDRLTDLSRGEIRKKKERRAQGHLPAWLATNHFCDEGLWFWVIPLQGKTSLGLVFDKEGVDFEYKDVSTVEKATRLVCERFPCLARDLPQRTVLDHGGLTDFSYDCAQTIDGGRWALSGEAGRFSDPLYSPGSDLIAIHNTLIVDAIATTDPDELETKCRTHEQLMRAVYQAYIPTYATSYDALGDAEVFSLKYTWELTIYFAGYVFPFINDLFTDRRFVLAFLRLFSRLGPVNDNLQRYLSDYYQWKKEHRRPPAEPVFHDFSSLGPLAEAEKTFYEVGVSVEAARDILARQMQNVEDLGRFILAYIISVVMDDEGLLSNRELIRSLDVYEARFDPEAIREQVHRVGGEPGTHTWSFDPAVLRDFRSEPVSAEEPVPTEMKGAIA